MVRRRTEAAERVAALLRTARSALGLSLAFITRLDGDTQHLEVVESAFPPLFRDGSARPWHNSLCKAIADGKLPAVIPDLRRYPEAMRLPAARMPRIRSYVSVPVVLSDGTTYGTFCAAGFGADRELTRRDQALMTVLSQAAALIVEPGARQRARHDEIAARIDPVVAAGGPGIVLQPIVELATGHRIGAEALSRFPRAWGSTPDVHFAEAHEIGAGDELEVLALRRAAELLGAGGGYVAMNVSPSTLLTHECLDALSRMPLDRIVLELSEHQQVADYDLLKGALAPLRAGGLRLAVDDVGAGFSSLRHIVLTQPDVIKLDRSIVAGVAADPVLKVLVRAMADLAAATGAAVVAEGIETAADAAALGDLGVPYGQGFYFARPDDPALLRDTYTR
ncbi:sensor domain-containing phosphodiesterase [Dactylosporangium matsuzakiense]|uniref:sensor domain-containing phosphodiesterase n=1 Tax=Dactylosporangium matsuzakiense TaxID=53360 RepID=UPI0021C3ED4A|nr:EAL domain-containing protein [Dactylosporangium matsuzakiense]UWZ41829.1 EAL domain-containing protein [Dactylosporangium matsuzakiense]